MLVAPFAPHIAEELWHDLGNDDIVQVGHWPQWDDKYLQSDTITVVVQVNGKLRAKLEVAKDITEEEVKQLALVNENVKTFVGDKKPAKVIYVPGRLVSIVI
jgi:leucyl-tRNA synthetase